MKKSFVLIGCTAILMGCATKMMAPQPARPKVSKQELVIKRVAGAAERHHMYNYAAYLYQKRIADQPKDFHALKHLAIDLTRADQLQRSVPIYYRALKLKPDDLILNMGLANTYLALDSLRQAGFYYNVSLQLRHGNYAEALDGLAVIFDHIAAYSVAQQCYQKSLTLKPDNSHAKNNWAMSLALTGSWQRAIKQLKYLETVQPSPKITQNLALLTKLQQRYPKSSKKRQRALQQQLGLQQHLDGQDRRQLMTYAQKWC